MAVNQLNTHLKAGRLEEIGLKIKSLHLIERANNKDKPAKKWELIISMKKETRVAELGPEIKQKSTVKHKTEP